MRNKKKKSIKRWHEVEKRIKNKKAIVAEIGVWEGKMSRHLLMDLPLMTLYMIDRWKVPNESDSYYKSGASIVHKPQDIHDLAYHQCVNLAMKYGKRAHIIKSDSVKAASMFEDNYFDLVFIDGDHSYTGCLRDILAWKSKVRYGGWLGGHDYDHPEQGNVKKAVDEIFEKKDIILGENRTWWIKL